jgi:hypothetical protein
MIIVCFRVPDELQPLLLREVRRKRVNSFLINFPVLLLIFSGLAGILVSLKGHGLMELFRDVLGDAVSDEDFWWLAVGVLVLCVAVGLLLLFRQMYRECRIERHLCCKRCLVVDEDDTGCCPTCHQPLAESAGFFSTYYAEEQKLAERYGLLQYKVG